MLRVSWNNLDFPEMTLMSGMSKNPASYKVTPSAVGTFTLETVFLGFHHYGFDPTASFIVFLF